MVSEQQLEDLGHIRSLMDRSSRFLSLSGLSGVWAGAVALVGAWLAHAHISSFVGTDRDPVTYGSLEDVDYIGFVVRMLGLATGVLALALLGAFWFTWRRSRSLGQGLWNDTGKRLLWNMLIPLGTGGLFGLALFSYGLPGLVAPATLIFYGLGLVNASKYTLTELRWLGLCEVGLGLVALTWIGAGLLFWAIGFGVLHIVYGAVMWFRYESPERSERP
ncbi:MAG TPA: hypothetical protein VGE21_09890 [Flavobacteriales bacterium]